MTKVKNQVENTASTIYSTKDYSIFKGVVGNRKVNGSHVANLTQSIARKNLLSKRPILVNDKMQIIDGQHRLAVAKANKLEIYYTIGNELSLEDIQMLNSYNRNWTYEDYLNSYVQLGKPEYIYFKKLLGTYKLPISIMMRIATSNKRIHDEGLIFKSGNFKVNNPEKVEEFLDAYVQLRPYTNGSTLNDRECIIACQIMFEAYSVNEFITKLTYWNKPIIQMIRVRDYLQQFENILSWKSKSERVRLY